MKASVHIKTCKIFIAALFLETTQMFIRRWTDKHTVIYPYKEISCIHKKKWTDTFDNMNFKIIMPMLRIWFINISFYRNMPLTGFVACLQPKQILVYLHCHHPRIEYTIFLHYATKSQKTICLYPIICCLFLDLHLI